MKLKINDEPKSAAHEAPIWDDDSIQQVIRAAARRGVCPSVVLSETDSHDHFLNQTPTIRIGD